MQSPASSGLLPASYSRRRRNARPNEPLVEGNNNGSNASYYNRGIDPVFGDSGDSGESDHIGDVRWSLSSGKAPLASHEQHKSPDDSENEENNKRRSNALNDAYEEGCEDVLDKPQKLSDFVINDRCYQRYLLEGKRGAYTGMRSKNTGPRSSDKGFMDLSFLANLCAVWSFVGMLFLVFIAIVVETQPLFIKGMSIKSTSGDGGTYRLRTETSNALKASAAYFLTMVFSLIYLQTMGMNLELNLALGRVCHLRRLIVSTYLGYRRRHYNDIPDGDSSFGVTSVPILPMHNNDQDRYRKGHRRRKSRTRPKHKADGGEGAVEGVIRRIKCWGFGDGLSSKGRKKNK